MSTGRSVRPGVRSLAAAIAVVLATGVAAAGASRDHRSGEREPARTPSIEDAGARGARAASKTVRRALRAAAPEVRELFTRRVAALGSAGPLLGTLGDDASGAHAVAAARHGSALQAETLGARFEAARVDSHASPRAAALALTRRYGLAPSSSRRAALSALDDVRGPARAALTRVLDAFLAFDEAARAAYGTADPARVEAAAADADGPDASRALGIDLGPVLATRAELLDAAQALGSAVVPGARPATAQSTLDLCPALAIDLAGANDVYSSDCALIVDVGGADAYTNNAGGSNLSGGSCDAAATRAAAAVIDLAGDDDYGSAGSLRSCGANGGGFLGAGFLLDLRGSDTYRAGITGVNGGGNTAGVGFLLDVGGDDVYEAGGFGTNGGGLIGGAGFLLDTAGNDSYSAADQGTNGGAVLAATGLLVDRGGHDDYAALGLGTNGGGAVASAGYLIDTVGDDSYSAGDQATNGGGRIGASGFLFDATGVDVYTTTGNASTNGGGEQGVGLLLDTGGTLDSYVTPGGTATDQTVPKGSVGAQIDQSAVPVNQAPPAPTLVSPPNGKVFAPKEAQSFTIQATDPNADAYVGTVTIRDLGGDVVATFDTGSAPSGQSSTGAPAPQLPPGAYTWTAIATDASGFESPASASRSFTVAPNAAPAAPTLVSPPDGEFFSTGEPQVFVVRATEPDGDPYTGRVTVRDLGGIVRATFDTSPAPSGQDSRGTPVPPLPAGSYTWTATATDALGLPGLPSASRSFAVGNRAPAAPTLVSPPSGATFGRTEPQVFTIQATDADGEPYTGTVTVRDGGGMVVRTFTTSPAASGQSSTGTPVPPLPAGSYSWTAKAKDAIGAEGLEPVTRPFVVAANQAPGIPTLLSPVDGRTLAPSEAQVFTIRATDPEGDPYTGTIVVRDTLGNVVRSFPTSPAPSGQDSTGTPVPPLPEGEYTWSASATDALGDGSLDSLPRSLSVGIPAFHSDDCDASPHGQGYVGDTFFKLGTHTPEPGTARACARVDVGNTANHGAKVEATGESGVTPATVWPDQPGAHPGPVTPPLPGLPSSTCQEQGGIRLTNADGGATHVWLYGWQETATRTHLCVRVQGAQGLGGMLTVDGAGTGTLVKVDTVNIDPPCTQHAFNSGATFGLWHSPIGQLPFSVCIVVHATGDAVRLEIDPGGTGPDPVIWTPDPGTPGLP